MSQQEREAYSVAGAVDVSGLGRTFIFEQIRAGRLRARKAGRRTIILAADLRAFLAALPTPGGGDVNGGGAVTDRRHDRERDDRDLQIARLRAKVGELTMENELLRERAQRAEAGHPFASRRSRP